MFASLQQRGYFVPSIFGYILALCCAYTAVGLWCQDQPALIYIVPMSQWSVMALAWCRGHFSVLWKHGAAIRGGVAQGSQPESVQRHSLPIESV